MKTFISYKRDVEPDQSLADCLQRRLKDAKHDVFRDVTGIYSGVKWASRIQAAIDESQALLALISNASLESLWVLNEIDRALKLRKTILPILIEPLEESIEFQEYIPRFRKLQHHTFNGNVEETAQAIVDRLALDPGSAGARSTFFYVESLVGDDSENRHWRSFFERHGLPVDRDPAPLTLGHCFQLAALRSRFYQRSLHSDDESWRLEDGYDPALIAKAHQSFRQGLFCLIATGSFGLSGFSGSTYAEAGEEPARMGAFLDLLRQKLVLQSGQRKLSHLQTIADFAKARYEMGMDRGGPPARLEIDEAESAQFSTRFAYEDSLEQYGAYALGLPDTVCLEIDDALLPTWAQLQYRAEKLIAPLDDILRRSYDQPDELLGGLDLPKLLSDVRDYGQEVKDAWQRLPPHAAQRLRNEHFLRRHDPPESLDVPEAVDRELATFQDALQTLRDAAAAQRQRTSRSSGEEFPAYGAGPAAEITIPLENLSSSLDGLSFTHLQMMIELLQPPALQLNEQQAMRLAEQHRPDRALVFSNLALQRSLRGTIRRLLRHLARTHELLRKAGDAALGTLEMARIATARYRVGIADIGTRASALARLEQKLQDVSLLLVQDQASRIRLYRELGTLEVHDDGKWQLVEPATI